jgi:hypothetical protein
MDVVFTCGVMATVPSSDMKPPHAFRVNSPSTGFPLLQKISRPKTISLRAVTADLFACEESVRTITTDSIKKRCPAAGCENTTAKLAKHFNELGGRILIYAPRFGVREQTQHTLAAR